MIENTKQSEGPRVDRGRADLLIIVIGIGLMNVLPAWELLPRAESILVSWSVAYAIGYWLPPHPAESYARWMLERLILVIAFYLAFFKIPVWIKQWLPDVLAYGMPILTFLAVYILLIIRDRRAALKG
jgi:hypothetical protein